MYSTDTHIHSHKYKHTLMTHTPSSGLVSQYSMSVWESVREGCPTLRTTVPRLQTPGEFWEFEIFGFMASGTVLGLSG